MMRHLLMCTAFVGLVAGAVVMSAQASLATARMKIQQVDNIVVVKHKKQNDDGDGADDDVMKKKHDENGDDGESDDGHHKKHHSDWDDDDGDFGHHHKHHHDWDDDDGDHHHHKKHHGLTIILG